MEGEVVVKVFVGSSGSSLGVANLIANRLERSTSISVRVWDEGVFTMNRSILDRLVETVNEYDFAVMIWGADDVTSSKGASTASARDNVIFECGLFMGVLGKDRVFIVRDCNANMKIPSDFAGIVLGDYDSERVQNDGESGIRDVCDKIKQEIQKPRQQEFVGTWRSRYALLGDIDHREVIDELQIRPAREGIYIDSLESRIEQYSARGRIVKNQVIGEWQHKAGENFVDGTFMLVVGPRANVMYGYCTGRNESGATVSLLKTRSGSN
jgi:hypothetical protein